MALGPVITKTKPEVRKGQQLSRNHPICGSWARMTTENERGVTGMEFAQIRAEVSDRVLTITLNRPERLNAWTATMGQELGAAFDRADADDDVRAVVVTGAGRGFCAGADLAGGGETFDWREREPAGAVPRDNGGQFTLRVFECTKP
jgi:enoyl-CoA hydratase/carnithine racemase